VRALALLCLIACGRIDFDVHATSDGASTDGAGDDAQSTGGVGPRWIKQFGTLGGRVPIAGANGRVTVAQAFSGALTGDGFSLTGKGFVSTGVVRYAADGTVIDARVYDATGFCDLRSAIADGTSVVFAGFTQGSMDATKGICSIAATRQDPIALRIAADGTETIAAHWVASTNNAQAWGITRYGSGQLALSGVYGGTLMTDTMLAAAQFDPNVFLARGLDSNPSSASWSYGLRSTNYVHAGAAAAVATRGYFVGAFQGNPTLLGTPLSSMGGFDGFLARVDEDGTPIFVRAFASALDEPAYGNGVSVAALENGGVVVSLDAPGDTTYDGQLFPAVNGAGLVLYIDGSGALVDGRRFPTVMHIASIGSRLYAAADVATPTTIGGTTFRPDGKDVVIVELDLSLVPVRIVGVVGGNGTQDVETLVAIEPDALALSGANLGQLTFGAQTFDTGTTLVRFVGVVGL
jgi:hypothetical protein